MSLTETVRPGPRAAAEAEKVRTRLLSQVDEKRNPRTRATVGHLMDKWLRVIDVDPLTRRSYESKIRNHILPLLGAVQISRLDVETIDSFYAELRRCRTHCDGRRFVQHRTSGDHECDEHTGEPCKPAQPDSCRSCRRACRPHECSGLGDSTVRQIHWILNGALDRAVVWQWIAVNPAEHADKPPLPHPDPQPPTTEEAVRLLERAWSADSDWGAFVWVMMTTGARRGEMCGLRWKHLDLDKSLITIRRTVYADGRTVREKDTKTHQQRRVVLDHETTQLLKEQRDRARRLAEALGVELPPDAYVFSPDPDGRTPPRPASVTQRYKRMATRLQIDTTLKNLRHYSATELITAGVDVRTVAGRLGHGGGGATTLRVYTAWSAEADQRAAITVSGRMPARPRLRPTQEPAEQTSAPAQAEPAHPHQRIATDLRSAIMCGALRPGDPLPPMKELASRYGVATSTAHRAVATLVAAGVVTASRGRRAVVANLRPTGAWSQGGGVERAARG